MKPVGDVSDAAKTTTLHYTVMTQSKRLTELLMLFRLHADAVIVVRNVACGMLLRATVLHW